MSEKIVQYYERALLAQRGKIDAQKKELRRMYDIYTRNVRGAKIRTAVRFLIDVIINKIIK